MKLLGKIIDSLWELDILSPPPYVPNRESQNPIEMLTQIDVDQSLLTNIAWFQLDNVPITEK